jgi:hypothetical protein
MQKLLFSTSQGITKVDKAKNFIKKAGAKWVIVEFTDLIR